MGIDKSISRREFLKLASLASALFCVGCYTFPKIRDPEFSRPVKIDFYGLVHIESPEANIVTLEKIKTALDNSLETAPCDLITLELPFNPNKLHSILDSGKGCIDKLRSIGSSHEGLQNGLENTVELLDATLSVLKHNYTAYVWAIEHDVPVDSIDPRYISFKFEDDKKLSTNNPVEIIEMHKLLTDKLSNFPIEALIKMEKNSRRQIDKLYNKSIIYAKKIQEAYNSKNINGEIEKEIYDIFIRKFMVEDSTMAKNLISAINRNNAVNVAHFGGAAHFILSPKLNTLYCIMSQYAQCTRRLLFTPPEIKEVTDNRSTFYREMLPTVAICKS